MSKGQPKHHYYPLKAPCLSAVFLEGLSAVFVAEWRTGGLTC